MVLGIGEPAEKTRKLVTGRAISLGGAQGKLTRGDGFEDALIDTLNEMKGKPKLRPSKEPANRVDPDELELLYLTDSLTKTIVRRYVKAIVSPGYYFSGLETEKEYEQWYEWAKNVRLKRELWRSIKHAWVHANGYQELVRGQKTGIVMRLFNINPKTMDFQRESDGTIKLDELRNPVGFEQKVEASDKGNDIKADRIAHFKIDEIGDSHEGISPLEGVYKHIVILLNLDEFIGEAGFLQAKPMYIVYVGDEMHEPDAPEIDKNAAVLARISEDGIGSFPHYCKVEMLQPTEAAVLTTYADYFIDRICSGLDYPRVLITPTKVSARGAETQSVVWEESVREYQEYLSEQVEDQILQRVADQHKWNRPDFHFYHPRGAINKIIAQTIAQYVRVGAIQPDEELENFLRRLENLPQPDMNTHPGWNQKIVPPGRGVTVEQPEKQPQPEDEPKNVPEPEVIPVETKSMWEQFKEYFSEFPDAMPKVACETLDIENNRKNQSLASRVKFEIKKKMKKNVSS